MVNDEFVAMCKDRVASIVNTDSLYYRVFRSTFVRKWSQQS